MKKISWLCAFAVLFVASPVRAAVINEQGVAGAPVSVGSCAGGATKVIAGTNTSSTWALMPESADIRCELGTSADGAASPVPTATVGFLFKSNVLVNEGTLNMGSSVVTLRVDCCGVAGSVSVDTWHE